jgi:uncharacterized membrane protein YfcA
MNIIAVAHAFFLFSGAVLILVALIQLWLRKTARERPAARVDLAIVRIVLFTAVGVFAVLVGVGVIPMGPPR